MTRNTEVFVRAPAPWERSSAFSAGLVRGRGENTPDVKWTIKGCEFVHCNCAHDCPCQFNARPTNGQCHAVAGIDIETGYRGTTKLDGLKIAAVLSWPGAIHEGNGQIVPIVDERATPEQREALLRLMSGQDTDPGTTFFGVFSTTYEKVHDPIFAKIEFEVDAERRTARLKISAPVDARGEPIRNPVTGQAEEARIDLPHGFEDIVAEVGRGWARKSGTLALNLTAPIRI